MTSTATAETDTAVTLPPARLTYTLTGNAGGWTREKGWNVTQRGMYLGFVVPTWDGTGRFRNSRSADKTYPTRSKAGQALRFCG